VFFFGEEKMRRREKRREEKRREEKRREEKRREEKRRSTTSTSTSTSTTVSTLEHQHHQTDVFSFIINVHRSSNHSISSIPSTLIIETVRTGPDSHTSFSFRSFRSLTKFSYRGYRLFVKVSVHIR